MSQIEKGVTKKSDILRIFGKPLSVSHKEDGSQVLFYESVHTSIFWVSVKNDITRLNIFLDKQEIVTNYTVDDVFAEGPYYQTAQDAQASVAAQQAQAAQQAAQQAAIQARMHH